MAFASGKYALAICDRCGFQYPYVALRKEWTGFKTCPECYEPKHPQLEPKRNVGDRIALREPRPDRIEPLDVYVFAPGDSAFQSVGMEPAPIAENFSAQGQIGSVTISTS